MRNEFKLYIKYLEFDKIVKTIKESKDLSDLCKKHLLSQLELQQCERHYYDESPQVYGWNGPNIKDML